MVLAGGLRYAPAVNRAASALILLALALSGPARADVRWSVPFAARVAAAQIIAVGKVVRVEGRGPFTVAHPPAVTLAVVRAIRGCRVGEKLRMPDFGREKPPWADVQTPERAPREPITPPALGATFLALLPGTAVLRGFETRALYGSPPDPAQVERTAEMARFHFDPPTDEVIRSVTGGPATLSLALTNDTAGTASFDMGKVQLSTRPPGAFDDVHATFPALALAFRPHESRTLQWDLAALAPSLFTVPGDYYIRMELPAAGPNDFLDLHVERVERSSAFLCGRAQVIARGRVGARAAAQVPLSDVIALRGDPGPNAQAIALPPWSAPPAPDRRAIICWHDGHPEWVETETATLTAKIEALVKDDPAPLPPDARFTPKDDAPASVLHVREVHLRLAAP